MNDHSSQTNGVKALLGTTPFRRKGILFRLSNIDVAEKRRHTNKFGINDEK
jgi:hypothetical protein